MKCTVFRSSLKDFTYIYLHAGHDFDDLPDTLREVFGQPEFVMNLELTPERKLPTQTSNRSCKTCLNKATTYKCHQKKTQPDYWIYPLKRTRPKRIKVKTGRHIYNQCSTATVWRREFDSYNDGYQLSGYSTVTDLARLRG